MKYALLLVLVLFGCTTVKNYEARLETFVGQSEDYLIESWGPPNSITPLSTGKSVLTYYNAKGRSFTGGFSAMEHNISCNTMFTLSPEKVVTKWSWTGNGCKSK